MRSQALRMLAGVAALLCLCGCNQLLLGYVISKGTVYQGGSQRQLRVVVVPLKDLRPQDDRLRNFITPAGDKKHLTFYDPGGEALDMRLCDLLARQFQASGMFALVEARPDWHDTVLDPAVAPSGAEAYDVVLTGNLHRLDGEVELVPSHIGMGVSAVLVPVFGVGLLTLPACALWHHLTLKDCLGRAEMELSLVSLADGGVLWRGRVIGTIDKRLDGFPWPPGVAGLAFRKAINEALAQIETAIPSD